MKQVALFLGAVVLVVAGYAVATPATPTPPVVQPEAQAAPVAVAQAIPAAPARPAAPQQNQGMAAVRPQGAQPQQPVMGCGAGAH